MVLTLIFGISSLIVLGILSYEDYKTMKITVRTILFLFLITTTYALLACHDLKCLYPLVCIVVIYTALLLFGFRLGDYFVLISLWPFFQSLEKLWLFFGILYFLFVVVIIITYILKENKDLTNFFFKERIPFVPIITVAFLVWFAVNLQ